MSVKVKICGVTLPGQTKAIAGLGADYIGCIIEFPKSPRSVSMERAREIREAVENCRGVACYARTVGVVVNLPLDRLSRIIEETGIRILQLHGNEDIEYIKRVKGMGVEVWRVIRGDTPRLSGTPLKRGFPSSGGVAEGQGGFGVGSADKVVVDAKHSIHGAGGSGLLSDWEFAKQIVDEGYSVVLSGGLTPENVQEGITFVRPHIIDASSKLESKPGVKDTVIVEQFIERVRSMPA